LRFWIQNRLNRVGCCAIRWQGIFCGVEERLEAALQRLPPGSVFAGRTAAWLQGFDGPHRDPIEVIVPDSWSASARVGFRVRRARVAGDVVTVRGFPATTVCRTLADLCRRRSLTEGVVFVDMALIAGRVDLDALGTWVRERSGWNGIKAFRRAVQHADPGAESPMETRLRMLLVRGRLPRPQTQVSLTAADGTFLGRVDLFYLEPRLGIEYDGEIHRTSLVDDNRRQNRLTNAGFRLLRFTASDLRERPAAVVAEVRGALRLPVLDPKPLVLAS